MLKQYLINRGYNTLLFHIERVSVDNARTACLTFDVNIQYQLLIGIGYYWYYNYILLVL